MPFFKNDSYNPPRLLFNGHLQTIYPGIIRKIRDVPVAERRRISTPDNDFLDLDITGDNHKKLVIISHGLEGDSKRPYVLGLTKLLFQNNIDVIAWNFRGCSGELNKNLRFYHSGATEDLVVVIKFALENLGYEDITLVGFSLGGNLTLKYLGEDETPKFDEIKRCITFSVPYDLRASSLHINKWFNRLYSRRFLKALAKKIRAKSKMMPKELTTDNLRRIKTMYQFDDYYTAPLHGFREADHYYAKSSAIGYVRNIETETIIINALNDPLLPVECLDPKLFKQLKPVTLELTKHGGHCGYPVFGPDGFYWSEKRVLEIIG